MLLQFALLFRNAFLLQQELRLPLQGLLVISDLLLHLLNCFGIAICDKEAVEMGEVVACGFALHPQVAVAEVVIGGGLQFVGSHSEEPATDHDQSAS